MRTSTSQLGWRRSLFPLPERDITRFPSAYFLHFRLGSKNGWYVSLLYIHDNVIFSIRVLTKRISHDDNDDFQSMRKRTRKTTNDWRRWIRRVEMNDRCSTAEQINRRKCIVSPYRRCGYRQRRLSFFTEKDGDVAPAQHKLFNGRISTEPCRVSRDTLAVGQGDRKLRKKQQTQTGMTMYFVFGFVDGNLLCITRFRVHWVCRTTVAA